MEIESYEGVEIDRCPACDGIWLDWKEIGRIVEREEKEFTEKEREEAFRERGVDYSAGKTLYCPHCGEGLQKFNYAINTGVILDRCPQRHGIWLDKGELAKIQIIMEEYDDTLKGKRIAKKVKECPRCRIPLDEIDYEGERIDLCGNCGGCWCDKDELYRVVKRREIEFSSKDFPELTAKEEDAWVSIRKELVDSLECPICSSLMERINYSYTSGVIIDRCRAGHGIWLDKDEIEKIQVFVERSEERLPDYMAKHAHRLANARSVAEKRHEEIVKSIKASRFGVVNRFFKGLGRRGFI
jgi:Zn-finger nucleic acid-binding protein